MVLTRSRWTQAVTVWVRSLFSAAYRERRRDRALRRLDELRTQPGTEEAEALLQDLVDLAEHPVCAPTPLSDERPIPVGVVARSDRGSEV
jgi:hypothetical protein